MEKILLTIEHNGIIFSPPILDGIKLEWERTGSPGKLTFTTVKIMDANMNFQEGDQVCFSYDGKQMFMGYVFTKKRDREHHIEVTCYDQIRYLKNKYTYVFEKKTASQIIQALANDFKLTCGTMENTGYVIPSVCKENCAALDIILDVLEDTLLNTGNMYILYDDFGKLTVRNVATMVATSLICDTTAENFDYKSSIDDETYNHIVLYYKGEDEKIQLFEAKSDFRMKQWGTLRYFEEVKNPTIGQNKANSLLKLYNRKTRELKVSGAFGDPSVRAGMLIPVKLYLGDINVQNYCLVEKVVHNFENDHHTMDLTLEGGWE